MIGIAKDGVAQRAGKEGKILDSKREEFGLGRQPTYMSNTPTMHGRGTALSQVSWHAVGLCTPAGQPLAARKGDRPGT